MGFFDTFPNERGVLPVAQAPTPLATDQLLHGLEGCDHSVPLGDGLKIVDLLARLTSLPSPTDMSVTGRFLMFILTCWRQQDDPPKLHEPAVQGECSKLAVVLKWLGESVSIAATVDTVAAGLGRDALASLSGGFRRLADGIEAECETHPRIVRWASSLPWWLKLSAAFRPWSTELSRMLADPAQRFGTDR